MKKLFSLVMAFVMTMTLTTVAFAVDVQGTIENTRGSITINDVLLDENNKPVATYEIYQILKLDSFNFTTGSYDYSYNDTWKDFLTTGEGKDYITVNPETHLIVWNGSDSATRVSEFAEKALAYAKANGIAPTKTTVIPQNGTAEYTVSGTSIVFEDLQLGYYLVDSTVGALCGLSTTNPNGIINPKNGIPTIDKQVMEDSTSQWGGTNTADIGQIVDFRVTVEVQPGAQNYVLHDEFDEGFTFVHDTDAGRGILKLEHVIPKTDGSPSQITPIPSNYYTIVIDDSQLPDSEKKCSPDCAFEIRFTEEFCEHLNTNDKIGIHYNAMLNRHANTGTVANVNTAWLTFGEGHTTTPDATETYSYAFDLVKTNGQGQLLDGASFLIYDSAANGNVVAVVPWKATDTSEWDGVTYRRARTDETGVEKIIVTGGHVRLLGFDNGTYYLEEIDFPEGHNKLEGRQSFTISGRNLDATIVGDVVSTNSGVQVVNHSGTMLPETGGFGTTMFITCGSVLVLACGLLLVTKKRMTMIKD